jgi:hypothetical protein
VGLRGRGGPRATRLHGAAERAGRGRSAWGRKKEGGGKTLTSGPAVAATGGNASERSVAGAGADTRAKFVRAVCAREGELGCHRSGCARVVGSGPTLELGRE